MIKKTDKRIEEIVKSLPKNLKTVDIGGAYAPIRRADYVIDAIPYSSINWSLAKGGTEQHLTEKTCIQHDICDRKSFPFPNKFFDYSFCSHTLEDIRDPIWVCSEIIRISKAGYIEIPSRLYETTFRAEVKGLAGAAHHRWIVDIDKKGRLRFTFKYMHVHTRSVNKNRIKYDKNNPDMVLATEWSGSFDYFENWLNSGKETFEYYLNRPITEKEKWRIYRKTYGRNFILNWIAYIKKVYFPGKIK